MREAAETTDESELEKLQKQVEFTQTAWRKRRKQCFTILDAIGEGLDKKRAQMIEDLDIETDESVGVTLPTVQPPAKRRRLK